MRGEEEEEVLVERLNFLFLTSAYTFCRKACLLVFVFSLPIDTISFACTPPPAR